MYQVVAVMAIDTVVLLILCFGSMEGSVPASCVEWDHKFKNVMVSRGRSLIISRISH